MNEFSNITKTVIRDFEEALETLRSPLNLPRALENFALGIDLVACRISFSEAWAVETVHGLL